MYEPLSNFYTRVVQNQVRHVYWSGTITADDVVYPFDESQIVAKSGKIINEIAGSKMEIGTTYSSELDIGIFIDDIGVPRDKIYGAKIALQCVMSANGMQAPCPMGVFNVVEAKQKGQVCSIVAYDNMILFDAEFAVASSLISPYVCAESLCTDCGVVLGNSQLEFSRFPNSEFMFQMNWDVEGKTYRDVLSQLATAIGCSAHMNRAGELIFLPLTDKPSVATLEANDRFGSDIAHTQWTPKSFYVRNAQDGAITAVGEGQLAFDFGENTFLQYPGVFYNVEQRQEQVSITDMLNSIRFSAGTATAVPVDADIPLDPCLDLFDFVTLTGGQADSTKVLITSLTHTIGGGTELNCAGANTTEESAAISHSGGGNRDDWVWVSGDSNYEDPTWVNPSGENWEEQLNKTWNNERSSTWDEILNGGNWAPLFLHDNEEGFQRQFTQEFTIGVFGLTVNYRAEEQVEVRFRVRITKWAGGWEPVAEWQTTQISRVGVNEVSLVVPFAIHDPNAATYFFNAHFSAIDD